MSVSVLTFNSLFCIKGTQGCFLFWKYRYQLSSKYNLILAIDHEHSLASFLVLTEQAFLSDKIYKDKFKYSTVVDIWLSSHLYWHSGQNKMRHLGPDSKFHTKNAAYCYSNTFNLPSHFTCHNRTDQLGISIILSFFVQNSQMLSQLIKNLHLKLFTRHCNPIGKWNFKGWHAAVVEVSEEIAYKKGFYIWFSMCIFIC